LHGADYREKILVTFPLSLWERGPGGEVKKVQANNFATIAKDQVIIPQLRVPLIKGDLRLSAV